MRTMTDRDDDLLDDLFATARRARAEPGADLVARVLADAAAQPGPVTLRETAGLWSRLLDALGGWPALGGVAAAGGAGLWIGIAPPAPVEDLAAGWVGTTQVVGLFPDLDALETETSDG